MPKIELHNVLIGGRVYRTRLTQDRVNQLLVQENTKMSERKDVDYIHERLTTWEECDFT